MPISIEISNRWYKNSKRTKILFLCACALYLRELHLAMTYATMTELAIGMLIFLIVVSLTIIDFYL